MVMTFEETKEIEELKQRHRLNMKTEELYIAGMQHGYRMDELRLELEIEKKRQKTKRMQEGSAERIENKGW